MIFVDSGAILALMIPGDDHHEAASAYYQSIANGVAVMSSWPAILEAILSIERQKSHRIARFLIESVAAGGWPMLEVDSEIIESALRIDDQYRDARMGFVDCTSLALIERHKIQSVFTFDRRHFGLYRPRFTKHLTLVPE